MLKKIGYGWIDPDTCIERDNIHSEEENEADEDEIYDCYDEDDNRTTEVKLYDLSLTHDENFEDGTATKYILLPINRIDYLGDKSYTPLVNAGAKLIMNYKQFAENSITLMDFMVFDYDSIFGLRLLSFQKYNSDFFSCDERVFFETLLIKFHSFNFKPFFISYPTIQKELGIKKDRLITISKKFQKLGFLTSEIKTSLIENRPSQITYYALDADKIMELLPQIYKRKDFYDIENDLKKYLEPALKKVNDSSIDDSSRFMA